MATRITYTSGASDPELDARFTNGAWPGIQSFPGWKSSGSTGKGGLGPYYVQGLMREPSQTVAG